MLFRWARSNGSKVSGTVLQYGCKLYTQSRSSWETWSCAWTPRPAESEGELSVDVVLLACDGCTLKSTSIFYHEPDTVYGAYEDVCCVDIVPGGDEEVADPEARVAHACTVHPSYEHHQLSCLLPCDHVVLHDPAYRHKQCINVSKWEAQFTQHILISSG